MSIQNIKPLSRSFEKYLNSNPLKYSENFFSKRLPEVQKTLATQFGIDFKVMRKTCGLQYMSDVLCVSNGLKRLVNICETITNLEAFTDTTETNPQDFHEKVIEPTKNLLQEILNSDCLNSRCDRIDLSDLRAPYNEKREALQELFLVLKTMEVLETKQNVALFKEKLPDLLKALNFVKDIEVEKLGRELKSYVSQYQIKNLWQIFSSRGWSSLHSLSRTGIHYKNLFHLHDTLYTPSVEKKLESEDITPLNNQNELLPIYRFSSEILAMIFVLSENEGACSHVSILFREIVLDSVTVKYALEKLCEKIGMSYPFMEFLLKQSATPKEIQKNPFFLLKGIMVKSALLANINAPEKKNLFELHAALNEVSSMFNVKILSDAKWLLIAKCLREREFLIAFMLFKHNVFYQYIRDNAILEAIEVGNTEMVEELLALEKEAGAQFPQLQQAQQLPFLPQVNPYQVIFNPVHVTAPQGAQLQQAQTQQQPFHPQFNPQQMFFNPAHVPAIQGAQLQQALAHVRVQQLQQAQTQQPPFPPQFNPQQMFFNPAHQGPAPQGAQVQQLQQAQQQQLSFPIPQDKQQQTISVSWAMRLKKVAKNNQRELIDLFLGQPVVKLHLLEAQEIILNNALKGNHLQLVADFLPSCIKTIDSSLLNKIFRKACIHKNESLMQSILDSGCSLEKQSLICQEVRKGNQESAVKLLEEQYTIIKNQFPIEKKASKIFLKQNYWPAIEAAFTSKQFSVLKTLLSAFPHITLYPNNAVHIDKINAIVTEATAQKEWEFLQYFIENKRLSDAIYMDNYRKIGFSLMKSLGKEKSAAFLLNLEEGHPKQQILLGACIQAFIMKDIDLAHTLLLKVFNDPIQLPHTHSILKNYEGLLERKDFETFLTSGSYNAQVSFLALLLRLEFFRQIELEADEEEYLFALADTHCFSDFVQDALQNEMVKDAVLEGFEKYLNKGDIDSHLEMNIKTVSALIKGEQVVRNM